MHKDIILFWNKTFVTIFSAVLDCTFFYLIKIITFANVSLTPIIRIEMRGVGVINFILKRLLRMF